MADAASIDYKPGMTARLGQRGDIALALFIVGILVVLILPIPTWTLDFLLATSMSFAIVVLMTTLFIARPLDFSSFPTVLLIATMLRLSLNLASTRLILAEGHTGPDAAGKVIEAFGGFVMGGNFIIGIIVFAILVLVNFIVITKGAGRIAEVSARFTLDAMPGKQMAIDADLSAGLISEEDARDRRKELESESSFFGAMDGAAKFVRGDAIAGLLITFINIIAGIIIGTVQQDLSLNEAAQSYTLLTVGDGLVTQIPALIVSTGAGLLVSKAGITGTTDKALFGQIAQHPKTLGVSSGLLLALGLLPGMPFVPFILMAGATGGLAYSIPKLREAAEQQKQAEASAQAQAEADEAEAHPPPLTGAPPIDTVRLELGYGLVGMMNEETGSKLTSQIKALRANLAAEMGFVMPPVRIQDNLQLPSNEYVIRIKEIEAGGGDIRPGQLLAMSNDPNLSLPGEKTTEPAFGLPAFWIPEEMRDEAVLKNCTVVDPATVITTHITEQIKDFMPELLSYAETRKLLDNLPEEHRKLIDDLVPTQISVTGIQRILQNLLKERISIRDLPTIMDGIAEAVNLTGNLTMITEHVRTKLARQICYNASGGGVLQLVTLSGEWEQKFLDALVGEGDEKQLAMAPSDLQQFITRIGETYERLAAQGLSPALLVGPQIRIYVRSIIERFRPSITVMSQNEVHPKVQIKTVAQC